MPHLHNAVREPVTGTLSVGSIDYTLTGEHAIRAAAVIYRGDKSGALALTSRRVDDRQAGQWPTAEEARQFAAGLLSGVNAMTSSEWVHRDLKPENVGLRDGWTSPVILDFGLTPLVAGAPLRSTPR